MKKRPLLNLIIIIIIIITINLSGCNQNENGSSGLSVEEKKFLGTWVISSKTITLTYSFFQNKTYKVTSETEQSSVTYNGTWRAENNKLFVIIEGKTQTGNYRILDNNKKLIITDTNTGRETILTKQ